MSETLDKALKLFQERNYKEAIDAFQVVIENEDESAEIYNNIGVSYSNLGDYKSAENYLNKALKLDSTLPQIYLNMSDVYYRQKEIARGFNLIR